MTVTLKLLMRNKVEEREANSYCSNTLTLTLNLLIHHKVGEIE